MSGGWTGWWSEWWTYRPSDFLMFSPRIYWRLFESLNQAWWPLQVPAGLLALAALLGLSRTRQADKPMQPARHARRARLALAGMALAALLPALAFHLQRFTTINWPARGFALLFLLLAAVLAAAAALGGFAQASDRMRRRGASLLGCAVVVGYPLLAPAQGRPWLAAEAFGLAPDPTALVTLALLALLQPRNAPARALAATAWAFGLLWCAIAALTLWTMGEVQAQVVLAAALAAVMLARRV